MSYTIADLDEAIQEGKWDQEDNGYRSEGWHEFAEAASNSHKYVNNIDPADYPGIELDIRERSDGTKYAYVPLPNPGVRIPGIGQAFVLEDHGGEGQGDEYWLIFQVVADGVTKLYRRNGWYASYSGGEYDGPTEEVKPVQKLVTVYEKVA